MKIHKHLVIQIVNVLQTIFTEQAFADKEIERLFKSDRKLGSRDRKFIAESVYELVRWWKKYFFYAYCFNNPKELQTDFSHIDDEFCFDSKYLNDGPFVFLMWVMWWYDKKHDANHFTVDFVTEKDFIDIRKFLKNAKGKKWGSAIEHSIPLWMDKFGKEQFGSDWPALIETLNKQASVYLRTNTLKISREQLLAHLTQEKVPVLPVENVPTAVVLTARKNVFITEAFKKGFFEMQDVASQMVAPFLRVEPGQRVIDACAGAGGKSLHLAQLMKNKGKIISLDIHQWKLDELRKRAKRAGVDIIESRVVEDSKTIKRLQESCDRLLLDVPCSGFGVLRRNPDRKWKMSESEIRELVELQRKIITDYSSMLKVGGFMVYATCSVLPVENQLQVEWFLENNKNFAFVEEIKVNPVETGYDGFYAALIKRNS